MTKKLFTFEVDVGKLHEEFKKTNKGVRSKKLEMLTMLALSEFDYLTIGIGAAFGNILTENPDPRADEVSKRVLETVGISFVNNIEIKNVSEAIPNKE